MSHSRGQPTRELRRESPKSAACQCMADERVAAMMHFSRVAGSTMTRSLHFAQSAQFRFFYTRVLQIRVIPLLRQRGLTVSGLWLLSNRGHMVDGDASAAGPVLTCDIGESLATSEQIVALAQVILARRENHRSNTVQGWPLVVE